MREPALAAAHSSETSETQTEQRAIPLPTRVLARARPLERQTFGRRVSIGSRVALAHDQRRDVRQDWQVSSAVFTGQPWDDIPFIRYGKMRKSLSRKEN